MIEHGPRRPEAPSSILEDLLGRSERFMQGLLADHVKGAVERTLEWTFRRVIRFACAAASFATSMVFLLVAAVEGLKQAGVPAWMAYLIPGTAGILGGRLLLRRPEERRISR